MIRNYFKTALRNLIRNKTFSAINIVGLAISMSICLLVLTIIIDQYTFDTFHVKKDNIYRILTNKYYAERGRTIDFATSPIPLGQSMVEEHTSVESVVNINSVRGSEDANTGEKIVPIEGLYVSEDFFDMFSFDLIQGDPSTVLIEPFSIVLTESSLKKLFADDDVIGKTISFEEVGEFKITGVVKDPPRNSHIKFESLRSFSTIASLEQQDKHRQVTDVWTSFFHNYTYFTLKDNSDLTSLNSYLTKIGNEKYADVESMTVDFEVQAFNDIHPGRELSNTLSSNFPKSVLLFLSGLALIIMLSACFNYANLSIAKALTRAKEVGIRKTAGAQRKHIFIQFIAEAVIVAFLALILGYLLFNYIMAPGFYSIDEFIHEVINLDTTPAIALYFILFALTTGIMAGFFPAFYLSKLSPLQVLKNLQGVKIFSKLTLRKALIVVQFMISLIFIITATLAYQQFKFTMNFDLGFERENIMNIPLQGNNYQNFKQKFSQFPEVSEISFCSFMPGVGSVRSEYVKYKIPSDSLSMAFIPIDRQFIMNMGVKLIAGTNFPEELSDKNERYVIVNKELIEAFNLGSPNDAIGEIIETEDKVQLEIIGVMDKFHYDRIDNPVESFGFRYIPEDFRMANLKVSSTDMNATIEKMKNEWTAMDEVHEFEHTFFDDSIQRSYTQYIVMIKLIGTCAFLAITIAALGLLGMAIYTTQTRLKEIGVRKALGADVHQLVYLLSKGFMQLLVVATLLAAPAAYFINLLWMQEIANRIEISPFAFLIGIGLMLLIGLSAIGSQTLKAANTNPVDTLRNE